MKESSSVTVTGESAYVIVSLCAEVTLKTKVVLSSDSRLSGESELTCIGPLVMFIWIVSPSPCEYES